MELWCDICKDYVYLKNTKIFDTSFNEVMGFVSAISGDYGDAILHLDNNDTKKKLNSALNPRVWPRCGNPKLRARARILETWVNYLEGFVFQPLENRLKVVTPFGSIYADYPYWWRS